MELRNGALGDRHPIFCHGCLSNLFMRGRDWEVPTPKKKRRVQGLVWIRVSVVWSQIVFVRQVRCLSHVV